MPLYSAPDPGPANIRRLKPAWSDAIFLGAVVSWSGWYLQNAWRASPTVENMLLIGPVAILIFALAAVILWQILRPSRTAPARQPERPSLRVIGSMGLLGLYVLAMNRIGFDLATFLYVAGSLVLLGERRPFVVLLLPLGFALAVTWGLTRLASMPIPTLTGL